MNSIVKSLAVELAKREGKKVQVTMGNAREIVGIVSDILYQEYVRIGAESYMSLVKNGERRSRKKK